MILLYLSISFILGYITCALLTKGERADVQILEMGIIMRDKTIKNQKLKIAEQAEAICNLKDSVAYYEDMVGFYSHEN